MSDEIVELEKEQYNLKIDMFLEKLDPETPSIYEQVIFLLFFLVLLSVYIFFLVFCFRKVRSQTSSGGGRMERFSLGTAVGGERTSTVVIMGERAACSEGRRRRCSCKG
eukprot:TRINITY_DN4460_c0_g1_i1.p1 TRINITY_DN4460_c0_g1~~TRINITY_DN4460_c0_g1_i1.p1  ORF type:complete len:109 (-),score=30.74 TRINITY_DN4460_c0_g1_i1:87-413(-)